MENWLPVVGYEDLYEVSDLGRVRSLDRVVVTKLGVRKTHRGKLLRLSPVTVCKYPSLHLTAADGTVQLLYVHTLVLEAFVGPRPPGAEACHGPGGVDDNTPANLRWDSHDENMRDLVRAGKHHWSRYDVLCAKCGGLREGVRRDASGYVTRRYCIPCYRNYQRDYQRKLRAERGL
jgi:hypothetical protein